MKKLICILLSTTITLNPTINNFATSISSNVPIESTEISEREEKSQVENNQNNKITNEIMLMNFIGVRLEEIIRTESTVLLKDTIDLIQKGGIKFTTIDKKTQSYLQSLFDSTTDWKLEEMDRDRLLYNYSQRESRAMSEALKPGVMALLTTAIASATTKDPLTAVLSIGSLVADGVSSYYGSIEQSEQDYDEGNFKLDKERLKTIEGIKKNFFDYCNDMVRDNNIPENMIVYQTKAEKHGENLLESNLSSRLKYFEDNANLFDGLPSIHLELAKCYFEKGDYKKCVAEIDKYNESNINIFNNDETLINTFPLAFAAASKYMSSSEYETYVVKNMKYAEELENLLLNGDIKNMLPMFRYKNILVYMDLYGKTNKKEYLDKAYDKCKTNIIPLVREQKKLNDNDDREISELLINNLEALKVIGEKKGISQSEKQENNKLIFGDSEEGELFSCFPINEYYFYGNYSELSGKYSYTEWAEKRIYVPKVHFVDDGNELSNLKVYINSLLGTNDSNVQISFVDKNNKKYAYDLEYSFTQDTYFYAYSLDNFSSEIEDISFNDIIDFTVVVEPKANLNMDKIVYNLKCIKMPFVRDEWKNYTVDEAEEILLDLGFYDDRIYKVKNKGFLEKDDRKVKEVRTALFDASPKFEDGKWSLISLELKNEEGEFFSDSFPFTITFR